MKFKILTVLLLLPLLSFADGKKTYQDNCEKCHGFSQQGFLGLPLHRSTIANHTDDYLKKTIKYGRTGRVMPKFDLSDDQVNGLILFLRSGLSAPKYSDAPITGNRGRGKYYYEISCAQCHGDKLQGGEGVGVYLYWQNDHNVSPPALANQAFLHSASDQMIKHIILNGIESSEMSSHANRLNDEMTNDIVAYIRSHERPMADGQTPDDSPLSFVYESGENMMNTINKLKQGAAAYDFELYPSRHLIQNQDDRKQVIVRFFNADNVIDFVKIDQRLGLILPLRATIMERSDKKVVVVIENYAYTLKHFENEAMNKAANELNGQMKKIIEKSLGIN